MRKLVILLSIILFTGASDFLGAAQNALAANGEIPLAAMQSREAQSPGNAHVSTAALNTKINAGKDRASLDLRDWSLDNQGRPLYDNNSFRFSTFRFQHEQENVRASVGDLSVQSSELIAPSLSRRGAMLGFQKTGYSAEAFTMRNSPVKDLRYGTGSSDANQILIGGRITRTILEDRGLRFMFHYLDGRNADPFASSMGPETAHQEGTAYSTAVESSIVGSLLKFYGEYCYSRYDEDDEDSIDTVSDRAWNVKIFGSAQKFRYALGYKLLGEDFRTIASPYAANNRDELSADAEYLLDSSSVTFSILQLRSNVEDDELAPFTVSRTGRIGYKLSFAGGPLIFVNQSLNIRRSDDEPAGTAAVDSMTRTTHFGISYVKGAFDLMPSYSISRLTDKTLTAGSSLAHTARLVCGIRPERWLSLKPAFTYRNYLLTESDVRIITYQGSLNSTVQIIPQTLTIDATVSYLKKKADDDSTGLTEKRARYLLSWNIEKYLRKMGAQSLAFMGEFMHTKDHAEELTTRNYTLSLMASIGLPFDLLEYQSQSSRFPRSSKDLVF
jgi:hypothetical protein